MGAATSTAQGAAASRPSSGSQHRSRGSGSSPSRSRGSGSSPSRSRGSASSSPSRSQPVAAPSTTGKRVVLRNVKKEAVARPPADARFWIFEDMRGRRACWRLGSGQTVADFIGSGNSRLADANLQFFKGSTLRVFFPIGGRYHVVKSFRSIPSITLARVLACIEATATSAAAFHLMHDKGATSVRVDDAQRVLKGAVVCELSLRNMGGSNQVYVNLLAPIG